MPDVDRQLVQRITERVLRALSNEPAQSNEPGQRGRGPSDAPASVHPAIGVCTGDYRQFTDRPDLTARAADPRNEPRPSGSRGGGGGQTRRPLPHGHGSSDPLADPLPQIGPVLTGFVTAKQVDAAPGDKLLLDAEAKLTPLAQDRARERGLSIRRASPLAGRRSAAGATDPAHGPGSAARGSAPFLWYADGHCPAVRAIVGELSDRLAPAASDQSVEPLASVVMRIARQTAGHASGAVLFVSRAAAATCFANRCRSLRAIVGSCPEAVDQGVSELAANVLIVEYPYHDRPRMREMVRRFIDADRPALPEVDRRLRELEQCA